MVEMMPQKIVWIFSRKYIAGESLESAVKLVKELNSKGIMATVDVLGEAISTKEEAVKAKESAMLVLETINKEKLDANLSIKPTQLGLSKSYKTCLENFEKLIDSASKSHVFVWIDMESSDHTDDTLELYFDLFSRYERMGVAIQANLKRSLNDAKDLIQYGAKIRLVKGAYREEKQIAYKTRKDVDTNFENIIRLLFETGNEFGIATHDLRLIKMAISLSKKNKVKFEFQLLKGVRDEIKQTLVKKGFVVSDYIPYGTKWLPYSIRRLKERKRNILLLGSSLIQSQRV